MTDKILLNVTLAIVFLTMLYLGWHVWRWVT